MHSKFLCVDVGVRAGLLELAGIEGDALAPCGQPGRDCQCEDESIQCCSRLHVVVDSDDGIYVASLAINGV